MRLGNTLRKSIAVSLLLVSSGWQSAFAAGAPNDFKPPADLAPFYQVRQQVIGYPAYPLRPGDNPRPATEQEFRQSLRFSSIAFSNLTPAKADAIARDFKQRGFNMIMAEGNRYLFNDDGHVVAVSIRSSRFAQIVKDTKLMVEACHRYGLRFFHHLTCTMVDEQLMRAHPDWGCIDIATGKTIVNGYGTYTACHNNDDFMREFLRRVDTLQRETRADGMLQDEIQYFEVTQCGCHWCRAKFKRDTGIELPADTKSGWFNRDNPQFQRWLDWRRDQVVLRNQQVRAIMRKYNPKSIYTTYYNNIGGGAYYTAGYTLNDTLKFADNIGCESEPEDFLYLYHWPTVVMESKYMRAVAERMNSGMWTLFYPKTRGDYAFTWLLGMSQGSHQWWYNGDKSADDVWQPHINWEAHHRDLLMNERALGNIGVLFSIDSRDRYPLGDLPANKSWVYGFTGTCNALTDGQVAYKVVLDEDLLDGKLSNKINTLVLFNVTNLSDRAVAAIRAFVKNGGNLVASGAVALYDENGKQRPNFALADVLGADYGGEVATGKTLTIPAANPVTGQLTGTLPHPDRFISVKGLRPGVQQLATLTGADGATHPGLLLHRFGKGQVAYFPGHPESNYLFHYYHNNPIKPGQPWQDERNPRYGALIRRAVQFGGRPALEVGNATPGIVVEGYRHQRGNTRGVAVHLANLLGGRLKEGIVPLHPAVTFPAVAPNLPQPGKPIKLTALAPNVKQVFLVSPDYDVAAELPFQQQGQYATTNLPALARYAIVYFSQGSPDYFKKLSKGRISKTMPQAKPLRIETRPPLVGKYDPRNAVAFAGTPAFTGGRYTDLYKEERGIELYGSQSQFTNTTATLFLSLGDLAQLNGPLSLEIGGMNNNRTTKAPIKIEVNGQTIFEGGNPFPDDEWGTHRFPLADAKLEPGNNTVKITNTGYGPASLPPWVMINYVKIGSLGIDFLKR